MKLFLARIALGRMFLHMGCICRGGKVGFHLEGLSREIRHIGRALAKLCALKSEKDVLTKSTARRRR